VADTHAYYCNVTQVRSEHMDDVSTDDVSADLMERAALHVYNVINAKLGKIHTVPFALSSTGNTPGIIREIAETLTACWATAHSTGQNIMSRGPLADECKRAREWLDALADGSMTIDGVTSSVLPESNSRGEHPIFFKGDTHDMGQDPDQADRLADERD